MRLIALVVTKLDECLMIKTQIQNLLTLCAAAMIACPGAAMASASEWHTVTGAKIRLVTSGVPDRDGTLRGALQIDLSSGWKTYWLDPGEAGVPPMLETEQRTITTTLHFPAPSRFDDGHTQWAGYDRPVSLPVTFADAEAIMSERLRVRVFLGVCETICVPVEAQFDIDHAPDAHNPEHAALVARAFNALPAPASEAVHAVFDGWHGDGFAVKAVSGTDASPLELFVAGTDSMRLGSPEEVSRSVYAVPVAKTLKPVATQELFYTLVTSRGSVSGTMTLPAREH
jgi:DsbC/DsbD-like thiol-disulfide interchange protein